MTETNKQHKQRALLVDVLERFGSQASRWPASERAELLALVERDDEARQLFLEAEALDEALSYAQQPSSQELTQLSSRILDSLDVMPEAKRDRPLETEFEGKVLPLRVPKPQVWQREPWPTAALLAASLVIGVWVGTSGAFDGVSQTLQSVAGWSEPYEADATETALLEDDMEISVDEDLL